MADLTSHSYDKGIPLCLPDNFTWDPSTRELKKTSDVRSSLRPIPQAIKMLQEIKDPVCVVSIAGPCRAGKSYIIDKVFGQMEAFPIGHLVDPQTTGIWMWISPQKFEDSRGRNFRVILLDSEGVDCPGAKEGDDHQIFTLTVLLASVLIYNSMGTPKRTDLDELDFIVKLSQRIRIRSKGSPADKNLFRNTFPFFFWLLRDVVLKLPPDCENFNQYFSKRVFKEIPNENQEKVAESILSFFSGFESFSLPPPSDDPEIIQHISSNRDKLNPKFREGVKRFEALLKSKLVPKRSINQGEYVTGEALGELVMLYTDAINDPDAIPNVEKAWDIYVKKKMADAKQDALEVYNQCMSQLTRLPCDGDNLLENHDSSRKKAMEKFLVETAELISTSLKKDLSELTKSFAEKLRLWKEENATLTQKSCDELLKKLKGKHLDPVFERVRGPDGAKVKYSEIIDAWNKIKAGFNNKAVGPSDIRADAFFKFNQHMQDETKKYEEILKKMKDYDENISKERVAKEYAEKERRRLEAQLSEMAKLEQARQKKVEMLEKRQQNELKLIKEQSKADIDALQKQIQIVNEAGMKVQEQLQTQLDGAVGREKEANEAIRAMKLLSDQNVAQFKADLEAMSGEIREMGKANTKTYEELLQQMTLAGKAEGQTIQVLNDTIQLLQEHRQDAALMRDQIQSLNTDLINAQKPGFISWVIRKMF